MKKPLILFSLILIFLSCQPSSNSGGQGPVESNDSYFDPNYEYVHLIPDSLRTHEQNAMLDTLQQLIIKNMQVEDDRLVFKMTKEEFVDKGVPEEYYDLIQKDLVNNNNYLDTAKLDQSAEEILENSFKRLE